MSQETSLWLNTNTLIGFTEKRGHAWHYRASDQGAEPNHYPGPVPVPDVKRRLFAWTPVEAPLRAQVPCSVDEATDVDAAGNRVRLIEVPDRKAILRSDTQDVLGVFKSGYTPHPFSEWLVDTVERILGTELGIGSAGLLKGGAVAWVQVETPETLDTPEGLSFRPNLVAASSLDGSLASTFARTATVVVCDNTLAAGLHNAQATVKVKHSRYSVLRLNDVRSALGVIEQTGQEFANEVHRLASWQVSTRAWSLFLDAVCPVDEAAVTTRSATLAADKRDTLQRLYTFDPRCAPWTGTALGVLQTVNTWRHHEQTVRGATRAERNALNALTGATQKADQADLDLLATFAPAPV